MSLIVIFENILSEFIKLTSFMKKGIDFSPLLCYSIIKKKSNLIFLALSFQLNAFLVFKQDQLAFPSVVSCAH